jgi:iron complex transport system permease protein
MAAAALATLVFCVCAGSVYVPPLETFQAILGRGSGMNASIILNVRLPRVITVMLSGAMLSLSGGAMQGLLRNPLADGSTFGVSAGASLGATLAIALGLTIPGLAGGATSILAGVFAFLSLALILGLAGRLDGSLSTNTIILVGVIFTMFAHALISLIVTFAGDKVRSIMFWTMGSLAGSTFRDAAWLAASLALFGAVILRHSNELNAFSLGEDNARSVGVDVRRVKRRVLIAVSALIGVSVSVGGTIGFVGLVVPHMTRMLVGPDHRRLLPASMFAGGVFSDAGGPDEPRDPEAAGAAHRRDHVLRRLNRLRLHLLQDEKGSIDAAGCTGCIGSLREADGGRPARRSPSRRAAG